MRRSVRISVLDLNCVVDQLNWSTASQRVRLMPQRAKVVIFACAQPRPLTFLCPGRARELRAWGPGRIMIKTTGVILYPSGAAAGELLSPNWEAASAVASSGASENTRFAIAARSEWPRRKIAPASRVFVRAMISSFPWRFSELGRRLGGLDGCKVY